MVLRRHRTEPGRNRAAFKRLLASPADFCRARYFESGSAPYTIHPRLARLVVSAGISLPLSGVHPPMRAIASRKRRCCPMPRNGTAYRAVLLPVRIAAAWLPWGPAAVRGVRSGV